MDANGISVNVLTFDRAWCVPQAIRSVLSQSLHPGEVIVVDDGSRDETPQVLDTFGSAITVLRQPTNRGTGTGRNVGVNQARGYWIAFLDADDEWYPFKLELQGKVADALPQVDLLFTDMDGVGELGRFPRMISRVFDEFERRFGLGKERFFPYSTTLGDLGVQCGGVDPATRVYYGPVFQHMWVKPFIITSSVLLRRDCVIPFKEGRQTTDADFYIQLSRNHWLAYIDLPTIAYGLWKGEQKISGPTQDLVRYRQIVEAHQTFYGKGEDLSSAHARHYRSQLAYYLHRIAAEYLAGGQRRHAVESAFASLRVRKPQGAGYVILALSCLPRGIARWALRVFFNAGQPHRA